MSAPAGEDRLDTRAFFWRIERRDGVALGFTSHDRDLQLDWLALRAAPGIRPAALRSTTDVTRDDAQMEGALTHDAISARDLAAGRFDGAAVSVGTIDWQSGEAEVLFRGAIGQTEAEEDGFSAELRSLKSALEFDPVPRTSPGCRARFCGPGCNLSPARFQREASVAALDRSTDSVTFEGIAAGDVLFGGLRWLDGPATGLRHAIIAQEDGALVLDGAIPQGVGADTRAQLREGCDRTIATCSTRFGNAVNFRGEPFLPGNDLVARYPSRS
ncbi:DUF2163 domain-containing protein [Alteriqipengyuania lutimaris]|uniref:DUF2163 domain-containing protein n=1 Tax=Alteriqipengyuania lutimaris TaxID=1538146 RepID=A0A395LIU7_9SPHN|nr:DUF2163 domain-containing protein [Alteriqipengyuania lutimaris]MBB3034535.1 putative phage protein (TIGR02218 family) [Alteriqipengyuania lutimaris]RDS76579.1 DUF2163 domain-containing protein [Alteriqipengyuania lutimaris]